MKPITAAILNVADTAMPGGRDAFIADILPMLAKERFFSAEDVADRYSVSVSCVKQWKQKGILTPSLRITEGTVRYTLEDLKRFENRTAKN